MPHDRKKSPQGNTDARTVLVTGGAGFVGSHTCKALAAAGFRPVVYDNLSNGSPDAVQWGPLEVGDLLDEARLSAVVKACRPVGVIHFAGRIEAGASVTDPAAFHDANVGGTLTLLRVMKAAGVDAIVMSSTAAVYGDPESLPIREGLPTRPVNPYGRTKLMAEWMLQDLHAADGLRFAALRYFNAAGADPDGQLQERHDPETHLIPLTLQAALGARPEIAVFGTDYDTPDGTCIRDYVHVSDLARAHVLALDRLLAGGAPVIANLGTGRGHSVREVIAAVEAVTGKAVPTRMAPRRAGDPAVLVAAPDEAMAVLRWRPVFTALETQIRHALIGERQRLAEHHGDAAFQIPAPLSHAR